MNIQNTIRIRTNVLLTGADKTMPLKDALTLKKIFEMTGNMGKNEAHNLSKISEEQLKKIYSLYGESGLYKLIFLAATNGRDFDHFFKLIFDQLAFDSFLTGEQVNLELDNYKLPQSNDLDKLNLNILQPSLSRKLYNPGSHPGYVVYGLGGPKILVSHPFQGIKGELELYDVYNNSIDVVTSLMMRGYRGTFLFLDYLPGLNYKVQGSPAWLVWFSIIAAHSDLVLFIKEYEEGFSPSQISESQFTPDRVQKKIVEIPHHELSWATVPEEAKTIEEIIYITGKEGGNTQEAFYAEESKHARELIELYSSPGYLKDRLFRIDESGNFTEYPLDYPIYDTRVY